MMAMAIAPWGWSYADAGSGVPNDPAVKRVLLMNLLAWHESDL